MCEHIAKIRLYDKRLKFETIQVSCLKFLYDNFKTDNQSLLDF